MIGRKKSARLRVSYEYHYYPLPGFGDTAIENGSPFTTLSVHLVSFKGMGDNLHYPFRENISVPDW